MHLISILMAIETLSLIENNLASGAVVPLAGALDNNT